MNNTQERIYGLFIPDILVLVSSYFFKRLLLIAKEVKEFLDICKQYLVLLLWSEAICMAYDFSHSRFVPVSNTNKQGR